MDTVRVRWNGGRRFVGWESAGHGVVMDAAEPTGDGSGVRPIELALYALGGCTAIDVIGILKKKRQAVTDFEVIVTGEQREEQPRRYDRITIEYVVTGRGVKDVAVARSIELSEEKYCSVRAMLAPDVELVSSYRILEEELEAPGGEG
jgi:putative redox protein